MRNMRGLARLGAPLFFGLIVLALLAGCGTREQWARGLTAFGGGTPAYYPPPPLSATHLGDFTFFSDGVTANRVGNFTFFSNGMSCNSIGSSTFCY